MSQTVDRPGPAGVTPVRIGSPRIDPTVWPDVVALPGGGLRPAVARMLFHRVVARLDLRVELPDGTVQGRGRPQDPVMRLVRPQAFYRRLGATGLIGFGEAYMAGDWDAEDVAGVLTVFAGQVATLVPPWLQRLRDVAVMRRPHGERGTLTGARRNVAHHYDLSNDLFALFLDPTMSYSSALFDRTGPWSAETAGDAAAPTTVARSLGAAQHRKIDRLLDLSRVGPGTSVLEIGTGWGELAIRAARRGAVVSSITLSEQQRDLALRRAADAGVGDRVTVELADYRSVTGSHDAVVSVEMIEAVGWDYLPGYFTALHRLTKPGGRVGLQAITMPHDRMLASRDTYTWVTKYIFPGGLIPSVRAIEEFATATGGLRVVDRLAFGADYARTLRLWRERFTATAPHVDALGFDATFRRMWTLYLAYSEAGFRSGYLDVAQFLLAREGA